jgi:hypothetical protein
MTTSWAIASVITRWGMIEQVDEVDIELSADGIQINPHVGPPSALIPTARSRTSRTSTNASTD